MTADTLETIQADIDRFEREGDHTALAAALSDAIAAINDGESGDHESYLDRLARIHGDVQNDTTARAYARGLEKATAIDGDAGAFDRVATHIQTLRELHTEFREEAICVRLADALVTESRSQYENGDADETYANLQFVDNLSREYPGETLAARLAEALKWAIRASYDANDYDDVRRKSSRLDGLYQQYPSNDIAYYCYDGTHPKYWVACHNDDYEALSTAIDRGEELLDKHDHADLADRVAHHYRNAVMVRFTDGDRTQGEQNLARFETFYEAYSGAYDVPNYYARAIVYAIEADIEDGDLDTAADRLTELVELCNRHEDEAMDVEGPFSDALVELIDARTERGDDAIARERFEQLQSLADTNPEAVGDAYARAVKTRTEAALEVGDRETAAEQAALIADAETATGRLVSAELQTRLNFADGVWGFDAEATDLTVESESDDAVVVRLSDPHGVEQQIEVTADRYCRSLVGELDLPESWGDLTPVQQKWCQYMRGYAYHWTLANTTLVEFPPSMRLDVTKATLEAVRSMPVAAFAEQFGEYIDQHAARFADETPFVDSRDEPVSVPDVDGDELRYEVYIQLDDGAVESVSPIQIAVIDDEEGREVVHEVDEPEGSYGWLSMEPRRLFSPEQAKPVIENQLARILRDRHVDYAREPPEEVRVLGSGHHRISAGYADADVLPGFHDPSAEIPGYEPGYSDDELLAAQLRDRINDQFAETARTVRDAIEMAPEPASTAAKTTRSGE